MAPFTDYLSDSSNQISGVVKPSNNGVANAITAVTPFVGSYIEAKKQSSDNSLHDKIIGQIQGEFTQLADAVKQGTMTDKEKNLRIDARMRQIRSDYPQDIDKINTWVKQDLGLNPYSNTFTQENEDAKQLSELNDQLFRMSVEKGIAVHNSDGSYDKDASIKMAQKVNQAILMAQLSTKNLGDKEKVDENGVFKSMNDMYLQSFFPAIDNAYNEINKNTNLTDTQKIEAYKERMGTIRNQWVMVMNHALANSDLSPESNKRVHDLMVSRLDEGLSQTFGDVKDWSALGRSQRDAKTLSDAYGYQARDGMAKLTAMRNAVGDQAMSSMISFATATDMQTKANVANTVQDMLKAFNGIQDTHDVLTGNASLEGASPERVQSVGANSAAIINGMNKSSTELSTTDARSYANSITTLGYAVGKAQNPDNATSFVDLMNNNIVYDRLNKAMGSTDTAPAARQSLAAIMSGSQSAFSSSYNKVMDTVNKWAPTGSTIQYDPTKGVFVYSQKGSVANPSMSPVGEGLMGSIKDIASISMSMVSNAINSREINSNLSNMNKALSVFTKAYTTSNKDMSASDVANSFAKMSGIPFTEDVKVKELKGLGTQTSATTAPAQPTASYSFVDGEWRKQ